MTSLLDCFTELEVDIAVITETWLRDAEVGEITQDLLLGSGLGLLARNRPPGENGVSYGGVAVVWREKIGKTVLVDNKNPKKYEVMTAATSLKGHSRKLLTIACYFPPGYSRIEGNGAIDYLEDLVVELKRRFQDPYIIIAGDFNQWEVENGLANFADIKEIKVGCTRGNREIDRVFTNISRSVTESGTVDPLETEEAESGVRRSDHRIVYCKCEVARRETYKWETYTYRHMGDESRKRFREWVVLHDWRSVLDAPDANGKAEEYQKTVVKAVESFFPLRKVRRKSTDPPWMDKGTLKLISDRKQLYADEGGRTAVWKEEKKRVDEAVRKRKRGYYDRQKEHLLSDEATRHFYRNVKSLGQAERPALFDVRALMPSGTTDEATAETLAEYFNRISDEFEPLGLGDIPCTRTKDLPVLHEYEVAARIRKFKKPRSTVPGDIFPSLVTQFSDFLAIPLTNIYNSITESKEWPRCWKKEFVTIIPKKSNPESLADLRNISCTLLASKMYESYVLDWLKSEVSLRSNQYGGVKGLGTDHLLVNLWQQVLENAEDYRSGTVITSVDYSKAFNRMSFQHCLRALAKNGASTPVLELIATFLTDREMSVKVGTMLSRPRKVTGG